MNRRKISVIIPVYNTKKYLDQCYASLIGQTMEDFEVILIDDGSTDGSSEICDWYARKDTRFRAIHQANKGVSNARNRGLFESRGTYIFFMDSDDMLPPDAFELMLSKYTTDLLVGGLEKIQEDGTHSGVSSVFECKTLSKNDFLWVLFDEARMGYQGYVSNKLYKKSIIEQHQIRFNEAIYYNEDRLFITEYLLHCQDVQIIPTTVYYYRQRESSALGQSRKTFKISVLTELDANEEMKRLVKEKYPELYAYISRLNYEKALYWLKRIPHEYTEQKKRVRDMVIGNAKICLSVPGKGIVYKAKIIGHTVLKR